MKRRVIKLCLCKSQLVKLIYITCDHQTYSNEDHISEAIRIVEKAGYKMAFTTNDRLREALNPCAQPRPISGKVIMNSLNLI